VRIHDIITTATSRSLVILNEIFTSTSLEDADVLGREVLHRLIDRRCSGVFVTFLDELSRLGPATVSMVSEIDPDDPTRRTFQVRRREADGLAYAQALAHKYRLDEAALKRRLAR
jgi:DNA mismatch repair protein MutS